jgi:hypothetical protein
LEVKNINIFGFGVLTAYFQLLKVYRLVLSLIKISQNKTCHDGYADE